MAKSHESFLKERGRSRSLGLPDSLRPIGTMREWLVTLRALLAGETVEHEGKAITLHGINFGSKPPKVPVALGALGPNMLTQTGEASDGAALNWCTPEQVAASRKIVAKGAQAAGRDPNEVAMIECIRICVDDTELEDRRDRGASEDDLIDAFPVEVAKLVGYFGPGSGGAAAFRHLAEGLDTAIVRVVAARPGLESITAVMEACQPSKLPS